MGEIVFERTPTGQLLYDLCFTDLTPSYLARKHGIPAAEIRDLRSKARRAMLGKRKLSKQQRDRAIASAAVLNRALDR